MGKFGDTIKNLRKNNFLNYSQCYGARHARVGMHKKVEEDGVIPCPQNIAKISKALGANLEELLAIALEEKVAQYARRMSKEYCVSYALNAPLAVKKAYSDCLDDEDRENDEIEYQVQVAHREYRRSRCDRS